MMKCYCPMAVLYVQGDHLFLLATVMKTCIIKQLPFLFKLGFTSVKILKTCNVCCGVKVDLEVK